MNRYFTLTAVAGALAFAAASPAFAQVPAAQTPGMIGTGVSANGVTQFKD